MDFTQVIQARRTTREFSNQPVDKQMIIQILQAAIKAPSNNHLRQWDFVVVDYQSSISCIASCMHNLKVSPLPAKNSYEDMCNYAFPRQKSMFENAQYVILPIIKENNIFKAKNQFALMHFADTWCAIENLFLAATNLGLGYCMHVPSVEEQEAIFKLIECPKEYLLPCVIGIGYPSNDAYYPQRQPFDTKRIHHNKWQKK